MLAKCLSLFDSGAPAAVPLFLIHALGSESSIWDDVVARLTPKLRIIRIDLPGHGRSPASPQPYTLGELLDAILTRATEAGFETFAFGGISLGGLIAQAMAVHHPTKVTRLVLSNTAARIGTEQIWAERERQVLELGLSALAQQLAGRWLSAGYADKHPETLQRLITRLSETSVPGYLHAVAILRATDLRSDISHIASQTLIIHGSNDPVISREESAVLETIPGSRLEILDSAHLSCVESSAEFAARLASFFNLKR
jgi:3-oxoadipate enol-lactonase / 4-carboxymuconolactone decarboxylase